MALGTWKGGGLVTHSAPEIFLETEVMAQESVGARKQEGQSNRVRRWSLEDRLRPYCGEH